MAILNYGNQFKYSGKGYIDTKMTPVNTKEELDNISKSNLSLLYTPGMKVMVLNDEVFGPCEYYLTNDYQWKRVLDLNQLSLSFDKGDFEGNDGKKEAYLQLNYKGEIIGEPVDISGLLEDVEKRLETLENKEDVIIEDTNTFVETVEIVTEKEGENGLFIKFTYNDGNSFFSDITELEPKTYSEGVGILIGEDNVISVNESWFDTWFDGKINDLEERLNTIASNVSSLSDSLTAISNSVSANTQHISNALLQISSNLSAITEERKAREDAIAKEIADREASIKTLSEQFAKIRGVEYIKSGSNINVVEDEQGYVTISANIPEVDTTEIENRLDVLEGNVSANTSEIATLQEAIKNLSPEGEALAGDGKTITSKEGLLSVMISENESNILAKTDNGLFVQGIEIVLGDEEINNEEN